ADTSFFEWMTNSFERKDGSVKFFKRDSDAVLKELKFSEAYVVKFRENFDSTGVNPLTETFTISAKKIELGNGAYENEWV
ncbi:type VI secretion system tube protein TssD, partial [Flavobacterium oreochromis]